MPNFAFQTQGAGVQMIKRHFCGFLNIDPANMTRADPILADQYHCQLEGKREVGILQDWTCDALEWARNKLPHIKLQRSGIQIEGERVVVVGWSSGGQIAM
jgi:hypothetical protein